MKKRTKHMLFVIAAIWLIGIILLLSSCVTRKACEAKFGACGEVIINERYTKPDTITKTTPAQYFTVPMPAPLLVFLRDTLTDTLNQPIQPRLYQPDSNVWVFRRPDGRFELKYRCPEQEVIFSYKPKIVEVTKWRTEERIPWWIWAIVGACGLITLLVLLRK